MLEHALKYRSMGFSVIPIKPDFDPVEQKFLKKPYIKWAEFQKRHPTEDEIRSWWTQFPKAMIGVVTGNISKIVVVDCDSQEAYDNIQSMLPDSFSTPIANTPRKGYHLWFHSNGSTLPNATAFFPQTDFRANGGYIVAPPSINVGGGAYHWLDGLSIEEAAPQELPLNIISTLRGDYKGGDEKEELQTLQTLQFLQEGTRDNDIFHLMSCLSKGGYEKELAYKVSEIIAKKCSPAFSKKEAEEKVKSAYERRGRAETNVAQDFRDYCSLQDSYINLTDAYETLQFLQPHQKAACQVAAHRMCKEGILEKVSRGYFKKIEKDCPDIDVFSPKGPSLDIKYPLGIHDLIKTMPKNILVIAGEPNSGKTAYLLNFAQMNMGKGHEVIYFSSEMGGAELQARLKKFNLPMDEWRKIAWKERASDFASMVHPNAINIIDFMEMYEDFFKVGKFIKQIFDKLDQGIAFIALQKNKGKDEGLGGARGLEKARLYLAMEPGRLKIVKGKNWRNDEFNPNGKSRRYKLGGGCNFVVEKDRFGVPKDWEKED